MTKDAQNTSYSTQAVEYPQKKGERRKEMGKSAIDQFINHLEFVGYEIETSEDEKWVLAKHEVKGGLMIREFLGGIMLLSFFSTNKNTAKKRLEYLVLLNQFNSNASITNYSFSEEDRMIMSAVYAGKYDKKTFSNFLDLWDFDTNDRVYSNEDFKKFIE